MRVIPGESGRGANSNHECLPDFPPVCLLYAQFKETPMKKKIANGKRVLRVEAGVKVVGRTPLPAELLLSEGLAGICSSHPSGLARARRRG